MVRAGVEFWTGVKIKVSFMFKSPSSVEFPLNIPVRLGYEPLHPRLC